MGNHPGAGLALAADHGGGRALQDAGLFGGDLLQRLAQEARMVVADRRDRRQSGLDHVGRVEAAAHADLDHREIGRDARESEERRHRRDLEEGDRLLAIDPLGLGQYFVQQVVVDHLAGNADALVEAHQVRRGIDMDSVARGLGHGAQIGDQRTLAVGAGDMHHRRQLQMWRADIGQQALDALKPEIDELGMQPREAVENRVGHGACRLTGRRPPGCVSRRSADPSAATPGGPASRAACGDARRHR